MTTERRTVLSPKLVIFDCDGVLVDSEPLNNRALGLVLSTYGLRLQPDELRTHFGGLSNSRIEDLARKRWGVSLPANFSDVLEDAERVAMDEGLRAVPGVADVARLVSASGMATCVASNGSPDAVEQRLKLTGLYPLFAGRLFSAAGVARSKPYPDVFLHAAQTLGFPPSECGRHRGQPAGGPGRSGSRDEGVGVRGRTGHRHRRLGRGRTVHRYGVVACVARAVGGAPSKFGQCRREG